MDEQGMDKSRMTSLKRLWWFPAFLTVILLGGFYAAFYMLFMQIIPETNREIVVYMAGQLSGFVASAVLFHLGTSSASQAKTEMIAKSGPLDPH